MVREEWLVLIAVISRGGARAISGRGLGGGGRVDDVAGAKARAGAGEVGIGQVAKCVSDCLRSHDDESLDGVHRLSSGLDCGRARNSERPNHLDPLGGSAGEVASLAGENGGGRRLGVEGVRLAPQASILSARPDDLQHQVAFALQVAAQSDAVAAGSLNPESDHLTVAPRPGQKSRIAANRGRDLEVPKIATELVFGMPDMAVLVGVDADRDAYWIVCVCDAGCCHRLSSIGVIGGRLPGGRTALRWGLCQPPIRSLLARRVAAGTVVAGRERQILKARGRCTKGSTLGSQPPPRNRRSVRIRRGPPAGSPTAPPSSFPHLGPLECYRRAEPPP